MATYKWRIPLVQAVQFNGKNTKEVKALVGDTTDGDVILVGTGEYEVPEEKSPKAAEPHRHGQESKAKAEPAPVPPAGVPYDPNAEPAPVSVEKKKPLKVSEGDWVVKDVATGKVEVNVEGFPDKYEFLSA